MDQVDRWIERLAEYDFDIEHHQGIQHANADTLSRYPVRVSVVSFVEKWFPHEFKEDFVNQQAHYFVTCQLLT